MVQWLGSGAFTVRVLGSIPGQGTKIPHTSQKNKKDCLHGILLLQAQELLPCILMFIGPQA